MICMLKENCNTALFHYCLLKPAHHNMLDDGTADDRDGGATKRRRMQQLIQKSIDMASVGDATAETHPPASRAQAADASHPSITTSSHSSSNATAGTNDDPAQLTRTKRTWTAEEDARLQELVKRFGTAQWAAVAAHFPGRDRKRCRERFVNHVDPQLRRRLWASEEETQLLALHRELGGRWAEIARRMGGRSPEEAKNRFLLVAARGSASSVAAAAPMVKNVAHPASVSTPPLQESLVAPSRAPPKPWSPAEAETLRTLVEAHGATNWLFIASHLPGRTDLQCMQQWFQVLDPAIIKGKGSWSAEEDTLLAQKVEELGPKWTQVRAVVVATLGVVCICRRADQRGLSCQISRLLPGRVGKQCRERYLNHLDPSISKVRVLPTTGVGVSTWRAHDLISIGLSSAGSVDSGGGREARRGLRETREPVVAHREGVPRAERQRHQEPVVYARSPQGSLSFERHARQEAALVKDHIRDSHSGATALNDSTPRKWCRTSRFTCSSTRLKPACKTSFSALSPPSC